MNRGLIHWKGCIRLGIVLISLFPAVQGADDFFLQGSVAGGDNNSGYNGYKSGGEYLSSSEAPAARRQLLDDDPLGDKQDMKQREVKREAAGADAAKTPSRRDRLPKWPLASQLVV